MGTRRRRMHEQVSGQVTSDVIRAFSDGDRQRLHRLLRLKPWQPSPLDVEGECPAPGTAYAEAWPEAVRLRQAIRAAL